MDAVTICASNYLPFAKVLGDSFLKHHQNSKFYILVIDGDAIPFDVDSRFEKLTPSDLDLDPFTFDQMSVYYDVTELATSLKPFALKKVLSRGASSVIYLDPDIQVFSVLSRVEESLKNSPIVLTPHTLNPIPRDDLRPTEFDIMSAGTFNLGFIGVSNSIESFEMLDWWKERLIFDSVSDPKKSLFTDQRWIDLVPSYFSYSIINSPEYNVAYWNLHERELKLKNNVYLVDDLPLAFFHFSGYRPEKPWLLSKYVADAPRVTLSGNPALVEICAQYGKLATDNGWTSENSIPYGFANLPDGTPLNASIRRMYRDLCIKVKNNETQKIPTFEELPEWLNSADGESGRLNRMLFIVWKSRPDLVKAFPRATSSDADRFIKWARTHGVNELKLPEKFLHLTTNSNIHSITKHKGINLSGYLRGEFGVGQVSRLLLEACQLTDFPVNTIATSRTVSRQLENFQELSSNKIYPVTITVVNADQFEFWIEDVDELIAKKTKVIGVWAWEIDSFPKRMHKAFKYVDEIWTISWFMQKAIEKHTYKPVRVVPLPINPITVSEKLERKAIGIEKNDSYFLFIFDYLSVFNRKNPLGVLQAHMKAFPNMDGPKLIIKSINGEKFASFRERLRFESRDRKDVIILEDYLSRGQLTSLMNECLAYISLHRSEGYGLTIAEALSLGKPVVTTAYSGNLDFCDPTDTYLVPYKLTRIGDESFPYDPESYWAEPDLDFASKLMIEISADPKISEIKGQKAKNRVHTKFTNVETANFIASRVKYQTSFVSSITLAFKKINWTLRKYLKLKFN